MLFLIDSVNIGSYLDKKVFHSENTDGYLLKYLLMHLQPQFIPRFYCRLSSISWRFLKTFYTIFINFVA